MEDSRPSDPNGRPSKSIRSVDPHLPGAQRHKTGDDPGHRRLARTVGAEQRQRRAGLDRQVHIEQGPEGPIGGTEALELERSGHDEPPR